MPFRPDSPTTYYSRLTTHDLPLHLDLSRLAAETRHQDAAVPFAEVIEIARHADIFGAVLDDLVDLTGTPPLKRLQTVRRLATAKTRNCHALELRAESEAVFEVVHHVKCGKHLQIVVGVAAKDLVVEPLDVVADHQIGLFQKIDEVLHFVFGVHEELIGVVAVGNADGNTKPVHLAAAADFIEGALRLEVKDHNLAARSHLALWVVVIQAHLSVPKIRQIVPPVCVPLGWLELNMGPSGK